MIRSDKKLKELASIFDKDNKHIIQAIELLREEQPFEGAVGLLTIFFNKTDDQSIRKIILEFMNDLKDQSVVKEVITEIKKEWKTETLNMLISSCWQSGLDYSEYSLDLTEIFVRGDLTTAIECFTVIEGTIPELSLKRKEELIKIIKESLHSQGEEKRSLSRELLSILGR
ncbi:MAG: hypothetical protein LLG13_15800 [Bacteroidales bacterium]|nr:hypothetical protein [Bacteroidales bacterium]